MATATTAKAAATHEEETTQSATGRRPVYTSRVGNVEVAVWQNHGSSGDFYTASAPTLRYQDDKGEWKNSNSYGPVDLLCLAKAAEEASDKIRELSRGRGQARG